MTKNKIFFDLDGTLIDSRNRLYTLFCNMVPECKFSFEEYWELKRNKINHQMIIEKYYPHINFKEFENEWLEKIESTEMLALDVLYPDAEDVLASLSKDFELYILTARQSKENLYKELKKLNIYNFFEKILLTEHKRDKIDLLKDFSDLTNEDILVGDTGYDVITGKEHNLKAIAATHGFLSEDALKEYKPDFIIKNLKEISQIY